MEIEVILTGVDTVVAIVGSNIALMSCLRSDMKSFENKIEGWKDQFSRYMQSYKNEVNKEMKDFHGRLFNIESRYHQQDMKKNNDQ